MDWDWLAGFLRDEIDRDGLSALNSAPAPLLVVVDYAETRRAEVASLLESLAESPRRHVARVLLLAREAGDWWPTLAQQMRQDAVTARAVLTSAQLRDLGPLETAPEGRRAAFNDAVSAFFKHTGGDSEAVAAYDFLDSTFANPLFLLMAALDASDPAAAPRTRRGLLREDLLDATLQREAEHWARTARAVELPPAVDEHSRRRAVAIATLTLADNEDDAAKALEAVPGLAGEAHEALRRRTAQWLHSLYPVESDSGAGGGWLRPLEPDRLGEFLVASVLAQTPDLAAQLLARSDDGQTVRVLTVLTRAARDYSGVEGPLARAFEAQTAFLAASAVIVAQQTGDPIGRVFATVLRRQPDSDVASKLAEDLPYETVALRELAAVATEQALDFASRDGEAPPARIASLTGMLAVRLNALGRREEALAASEEAIALHRELAAARPDAFLAELTTSLNNHSNRLDALGRREEALAASEEAVALYRELAAARPDAFLPDLATSLNNLSNRLATLGRHEEALAASEEAVALRRRLAAVRPDAFLPDLATSLNNLSSCLAALGRREEALAVCEEAVALYRELAAARPDAFLPNLAISLNNLSNRLDALGRREEALAASEEAVALHRELAAARPDAFLPDLATSLNNLSNCLDALGRREEALAASGGSRRSVFGSPRVRTG